MRSLPSQPRVLYGRVYACRAIPDCLPSQPHVLYLTEENELRDCLNLNDPGDNSRQSDAGRHLADKLNNSEVVQDYVTQ